MTRHGTALFCFALGALLVASCSGVPSLVDGGGGSAGGGMGGGVGGGSGGGVGGGSGGGVGGGSGGGVGGGSGGGVGGGSGGGVGGGSGGGVGGGDAGCFPVTGVSDGGANPNDGGLNQTPIAILNICGADPCAKAVSVSLAALPTGPNNSRLLQLCGTDSYDPPLNTRPLPFYQFALVTSPGNAVEYGLENNGMKAGKGAVELKIDGAANGLYRVVLNVWDDTDQRSTTPAELKLNVLQ